MSDPQAKPPSPFALAPSAYPPRVTGKPAPVVVPPASPPPSVPQGASTAAVVKLTTPADAEPVEPTPPVMSRPRRPLITLLTGGAAVVLLSVLAVWTVRARLRSGNPAVHADFVAAPVPSATASAAGSVVPSASPPASATPDPPPPVTPAMPFDRLAARAALDALAPTLIDCKIPRGRSGQIKVAFASDGAVSSAKPLGPLVGTHRGTCVTAHLEEAHVAPFAGSAPAFVYSFVIPR